MMLSGIVSLAPFRNSFALSGIIVAFTGPRKMSALRNTGNVSCNEYMFYLCVLFLKNTFYIFKKNIYIYTYIGSKFCENRLANLECFIGFKIQFNALGTVTVNAEVEEILE